MAIEMKVFQIQPRDKLNKVYVAISFEDVDGATNAGGSVGVFVDHTDSYAEIRKRAIEAARAFLQRVLDAPALETIDT